MSAVRLSVDAHVHILPPRIIGNLAEITRADPWFARCHGHASAAEPAANATQASHAAQATQVPNAARLASADALVAYLDRAGIERAVCFTWPFRQPSLCAEANDFMAEAQRRHPQRIIGFGIVQPCDPGAAAEVERCARLGLQGLGEMNGDAQGWSWDAPELAAVVVAACVRRLPWVMHCSEPVGHDYPGKGTMTPDRLMRFVERFPELKVVAAHLGGGLPFYAHMPEVAAVCRRLWFDTAAVPFLYEPTVYRSVVKLCGAGRILFGSDFPLLEASRYEPGLAAAGLTSDELALVGGSAVDELLG